MKPTVATVLEQVGLLRCRRRMMNSIHQKKITSQNMNIFAASSLEESARIILKAPFGEAYSSLSSKRSSLEGAGPFSKLTRRFGSARTPRDFHQWRRKLLSILCHATLCSSGTLCQVKSFSDQFFSTTMSFSIRTYRRFSTAQSTSQWLDTWIFLRNHSPPQNKGSISVLATQFLRDGSRTWEYLL